MSKQEYNDKQLDYVEAAAMALAVGMVAQGAVPFRAVAEEAHNLAVAMLAEREKRYGKIESNF